LNQHRAESARSTGPAGNLEPPGNFPSPDTPIPAMRVRTCQKFSEALSRPPVSGSPACKGRLTCTAEATLSALRTCSPGATRHREKHVPPHALFASLFIGPAPSSPGSLSKDPLSFSSPRPFHSPAEGPATGRLELPHRSLPNLSSSGQSLLSRAAPGARRPTAGQSTSDVHRPTSGRSHVSPASGLPSKRHPPPPLRSSGGPQRRFFGATRRVRGSNVFTVFSLKQVSRGHGVVLGLRLP